MNNPSPTTISSITSKLELPLVGFPSGQREQTVNLPSSTSKVRILPPPPSLPDKTQFKPIYPVSCSAHAGKDEKVQFERSEKALPQATTRRAKRVALSNPSPTTLTFLNTQNLLLRADFCPVALRLPGLQMHVTRRSDKRSASDNSHRTMPIKTADAGFVVNMTYTPPVGRISEAHPTIHTAPCP